MKVTIIGRQMNVWDEMKVIIENKLQKFDKYFSNECSSSTSLLNIVPEATMVISRHF